MAVTVRSPAAVSTSPTVNGMAPVAVSSSVDWLPTSEIVGKSLILFTVNKKVSVAVSPPASVTIRVIVVVPN